MTIATPALIQTPWATSGDTTPIPVATDPNGFVNFTEGYTADYEISLTAGDPRAKAVERTVQNMLFQMLTGNTQWWQGYGFAPWFNSFPGGYDVNAIVIRQNSSGVWRPYRSLVTGNVSDPASNTVQWQYVQSSSELIQNVPMPAGGAGGPSAEVATSWFDLNGMLTNGTWETTTDAVASQCQNCPTAITFMLEVKTVGQVTFQRIIDRSSRVYTRGYNNGSFTAWNSPLYRSGDTASGLIALNGGGTVVAPTNQFDNTNSIPSTAWVNKRLGTFANNNAVLTGAVSITAAQSGTFFEVTANGSSGTLPTPQQGLTYSFGTVSSGLSYVLIASGSATIIANGNSISNLTVPPGGSVSVYCDGSNWLVTNSFGFELTAARFNSDAIPATTSFVKRNGLTFADAAGITNDTVMTSSNVGIWYLVQNGATVTLPDATNFPNGQTVSMSFTANSLVKVSTFAIHDQKNNTYTSYQFKAGEQVVFASSGGDWFMVAYTSISGTTPAQFDNSTLYATTAFVQRASGNMSASVFISGSYTCSASDVGKYFIWDGNGTFTLPPITPIAKGSSVKVFKYGQNACSFTTASGDSMSWSGNTANPQTFTASQTGCVEFITNSGNEWDAVSGDLQLIKSPVMTGANFTTPANYDNTTRLATTAFVYKSSMALWPSISAAVDLNTYTTPGVYNQSSDALAQQGANYPVGSAGMLEVFAADSMVYQRYTQYSGENHNEVYVRGRYNGTWGGWYTIASTSFVQSVLGNLQNAVIYTGSQTIPASLFGSYIELGSGVTSNSTFTLPSALGNQGRSFTVLNGSNTINTVLSLTGGGNFFPGNLTSWKIAPQTSVIVVSDGTNWKIVSSGDFLLANPFGYTRLPSGLIVQWGNTPTVGAGLQGVVTFPIIFPNSVYSIVPVGSRASANQGSGLVNSSWSTSTATFTNFGANQVDPGFYIAIGR